MTTKKIDKELSADIRNKLQAGKLALEMLQDSKKVPVRMVELALRDLNEILKIL